MTEALIQSFWYNILSNIAFSMFVLIAGIILTFNLDRKHIDKYRLKYGFDKDIESSFYKNPNRLARVEKRFNERMAKYAEKKYGVKK